MKTSGIKILEGRDLVETDSVQSKRMKCFNYTIVGKINGQRTVLLEKLLHWDGDTSGTVVNVVGVVNDYVYGDMYGKPDPVMFFCVNTPDASNMYVRLKPNTNVETCNSKN